MVEFKTAKTAPQARPAAQIGNATAQGLASLSGAMQGAADKFTQFYEKQAAIENDLLLAKTDAEWSQRMAEAAKTAGPGFAERAMADFDSYRSELMATAPKRGRDETNLALDKYRIRLHQNAINAELAAAARAANAARAQANRLRGEATNARLNHLISNPSNAVLGDYMANDPEHKDAYVKAYLSARMMNDPVSVHGEVVAEDWDAYLTPKEKMSFMEAGQSAIARQDREQAAERVVALGGVMADADEQIANMAANGASTLGSDIPAQIRALEPDPVKASAMIDGFTGQMEFAQVMHNVGTASQESLMNEAIILQADVLKPGNIAGDVKRLDQFVAAVGIREKAIADDAAWYVVQQNQIVGEYLNQVDSGDLASRQIATAGYSAGVTSEYDRLGVPQDQRNLLPKGYAAQKIATLGESDVAAAEVSDLSAAWNDDPRLVRELRKAGLKLEYASAMLKYDNPALQQAIIETANVSMAELETGVRPDILRSVDDAMLGALSEYKAALTANDVTNEGSQLFASEFGIARKLIIQAVGRGEDPATATQRIAGQMFEGTAVNTGEVRLIVPPEYDANVVEDSLADAMTPEKIKMFNVAPLGLGNTITDEEVTIQSASTTGVWFANSTGTGAVLHYDFGGWYAPVKSKTGQIYEVPFSAIHSTGRLPPTMTVKAFQRLQKAMSQDGDKQ